MGPNISHHSAPQIDNPKGAMAALKKALGKNCIDAVEANYEISLTVKRDSIADVMKTLRDDHQYQQLVEIAGVDYPERAERFEVVYHLLSLTKNHRIRVRLSTDEDTPVPTITSIWPVADWLEREVFDMYGVLFDGHPDLRRILTDYGFKGHPFRKDFPLTGYVEMRYSEEAKRVVYEPVKLAQDFRSFDFMSPWEGADYILPGDEKVAEKVTEKPQVKPAEAKSAPTVDKPKVTEKSSEAGAGKKADKKAAERSDKAVKGPVKKVSAKKTAPKKVAAKKSAAKKPAAKKGTDK